MPELSTIYDYMRAHAALLGERILQEYPALHQFDNPASPRITGLLRRPFPAQTIAIMGVAKRWQQARTAMVVAECGTGKTLISLGAIHVHSQRSLFTALTMVPPHLVEKWAREAFWTLPGIRVFLIDDLRNGGDENKSHGVNEVQLRQGRIVREGLHTTLSELRLRKQSPSSRKRWMSLSGRPALFIVGRERAKLGYFWRHAYRVPHSGPYQGCVVNPDTGKPVIVDDSRLTAAEFEKVKIAETIETRGEKSCRLRRSRLPRRLKREARSPVVPCTARCGRPIRTRSAAWPRSSSLAATCRDGLTTPSATRFTNWPETPPKGMLLALWHPAQIGLWA